ncbi:Polyketide synthase 19 [Fusarium oxysporum f. sp. albedinis]|nr:Polyketide synthase 19 [Fusarium oxysporum f. sp. albedinis]
MCELINSLPGSSSLLPLAQSVRFHTLYVEAVRLRQSHADCAIMQSGLCENRARCVTQDKTLHSFVSKIPYQATL